MKFIFVPLGSAGDINPLLWLARLLAERGHDVAMVMQTRLAESGVRAGLRTIPVGSAEQQESIIRNPEVWHPRKGLSVLAAHFPEWAREMLPAVEAEVVPGRTVLVGATIAFAARILAEARGLPLVSVVLQPSMLLSPQDAPVLVRGTEYLKRTPLWLRRWVYRLGCVPTNRLMAGKLNQIRAGFGLRTPMRRVFDHWCLSPDLVLALFPEWFGARQSDWPPNVVHSRFPLYDEAAARPIEPALEKFLQAGPPPVLFTPGSANMHAAGFFSAGVAACRALGRRALLITPFRDHLPATLPGDAGHFEFAPFSRVFGRCAALVHHGGVGTSSQGLAAGVPQLIMAMAFDQPDNLWRLRELGVADGLYTSQFKTRRVTECLGKLLNSTAVAVKCREFKERMAGQMAPERTAEILEKFAAARVTR